jgi:hypothetical protein
MLRDASGNDVIDTPLAVRELFHVVTYNHGLTSLSLSWLIERRLAFITAKNGESKAPDRKRSVHFVTL